MKGTTPQMERAPHVARFAADVRSPRVFRPSHRGMQKGAWYGRGVSKVHCNPGGISIDWDESPQPVTIHWNPG